MKKETDERKVMCKEIALAPAAAERLLDIWTSGSWPIAIQPLLDIEELRHFELYFVDVLEPAVDAMIDYAATQESDYLMTLKELEYLIALVKKPCTK